MVDIGAVFYQQFNRFRREVLAHGRPQRRFTEVAGSVDIGAGSKKHTDIVYVGAVGQGVHQRGVAGVIGAVDICSACQQELCLFDLQSRRVGFAGLGRNKHKGIFAVHTGGVDVGFAVNQFFENTAGFIVQGGIEECRAAVFIQYVDVGKVGNGIGDGCIGIVFKQAFSQRDVETVVVFGDEFEFGGQAFGRGGETVDFKTEGFEIFALVVVVEDA